MPSLRRWRVSKVTASPADDALPQALDGGIVEAGVEIASMLSDQLLAAVAQALAGLAVDVEHGRVIVKQEEGVSRVIHEVRKRASLARSSCSACLSSVMSCRTPNWRRGRPELSHVTSPWLWTTRTVPSGRTTRYSTS